VSTCGTRGTNRVKPPQGATQNESGLAKSPPGRGLPPRRPARAGLAAPTTGLRPATEIRPHPSGSRVWLRLGGARLCRSFRAAMVYVQPSLGVAQGYGIAPLRGLRMVETPSPTPALGGAGHRIAQGEALGVPFQCHQALQGRHRAEPGASTKPTPPKCSRSLRTMVLTDGRKPGTMSPDDKQHPLLTPDLSRRRKQKGIPVSPPDDKILEFTGKIGRFWG